MLRSDGFVATTEFGYSVRRSGRWLAVRCCLRALCVASALAATACQGIFQHPRPPAGPDYVVVATGTDLRVGFAEADITPDDLPYLAGFDVARRATGIHSRLRARAMVLLLGDQRFAIIGVDNLGVMREDVDWIKSAIAGFPNGNVFLCASHTHFAPDMIGMWGFYFLTTGRDTDYMMKLRMQVASAVLRAEAAARPASMRVVRTLVPERLFRNSNRRENYDRRAVALQVHDRETGDPMGALIHAACHPESLKRRDDRLSSDYVGALCDRWRDLGLGQPVFVNGALGAMIAPNPKEDAGCRLIGESIADALAMAIERDEPRELEADSIEVRRRDVYMRVDSFGLSIGRITTVLPRELYRGRLRAPVGYLRIGSGVDAFEAATVPGEMEPGLAASLRARLGRPRLLVFGLCDDEVGYLMSERDARSQLFAYERTMSPEVEAGDMVVDALAGASQ